MWEVMEQFNDVLRAIAKEEDLILVDLARTLPKIPEFFFDDDHYTIKGSQRVADIIASELERQEWENRLGE